MFLWKHQSETLFLNAWKSLQILPTLIQILVFTPYKTDSVGFSILHLSPHGSQLNFAQDAGTRIENIVVWDAIVKKYRLLFGGEPDETGSVQTDSDDLSNTSGDAQDETPIAQPVSTYTAAKL